MSRQTAPWAAFVGMDNPAAPPPMLVPVPSATDPPKFNPPMPAVPGMFRCRHCQKWQSLGDDPIAHLRELWPVWVDWWFERTEQRFDTPRPETPTIPNQMSCRFCQKWQSLGDDPIAKLVAMWKEWVDEEQERLLAEWNASPPRQLQRMFELQAAAEARADAKENRDREERRDQLADRRVRELIVLGMGPTQAHQQAAKEFPGW